MNLVIKEELNVVEIVAGEYSSVQINLDVLVVGND